jgi:hypothetical protein
VVAGKSKGQFSSVKSAMAITKLTSVVSLQTRSQSSGHPGRFCSICVSLLSVALAIAVSSMLA